MMSRSIVSRRDRICSGSGAVSSSNSRIFFQPLKLRLVSAMPGHSVFHDCILTTLFKKTSRLRREIAESVVATFDRISRIFPARTEPLINTGLEAQERRVLPQRARGGG